MGKPMRQSLRAAVERGFDFLEGAVGSDASALGADGGWPFWRYPTTELTGDREIEYPPLVAALGLLALDASRHPRAGALVARTRDFLRHWIRYPGVWSYQRAMTPNFDDTAINGLAVGPHPWLRMGSLRGLNFDVFLANRDDRGRFVTWAQGKDWPPGLENIFDVVVNANVLAYMGDHPETHAARCWVETLFVERREAEGLAYYPEPFDLHFAMARATCFRDGLFSDLRPTLVSRILERLDADVGIADPMRTAQALSALDMLGFDLDEAVRSAVLQRLLEMQCPDGSWPPCLVWNEPTGWAIWAAARGYRYYVSKSWGFASEVLTTAFCIESMERSLGPNLSVQPPENDRDGGPE